VNHPNVLRTLGAGRDQVIKRGVPADEDSYYIVSELAANGEAFDYVSDAGGLKHDQARQLFKQLIQGVHHLHENNIAHRDLKLENCFLDQNVTLKVADFGLSKVFGQEGE
jgi:serine/threonine protein kinase